MKKQLLLILFFAVPTFSFGQSKKQEAKKISNEINNGIDKISNEIENMDWSQLGDLLDKTLQVVEKNADVVAEIINKIDVDKMVKNADKIAAEIEKNINTKKIEATADRIAEKLEAAAEKKSVEVERARKR